LKHLSIWLMAALMVVLGVQGVQAQGGTTTITTEIGLVVRYPNTWQSIVVPGNATLDFNGYRLILYYGLGRAVSGPKSDVLGAPFMALGQTVYPRFGFNSDTARNAGTPTSIDYLVETSSIYVTGTLLNQNLGDQTISAEIQQQVQIVFSNMILVTSGVPTATIPPLPTSTIPAPLPTATIPNPYPTATMPFPLPTATIPWAPANDYRIAYFTADQTTIPVGGCVTLSYWAVGARQITLHGSNWRSGPEIIKDNPNQRTVCPSASGAFSPRQPVVYTLAVIYLNGRFDSNRITIRALPAAPSPVPSPVPTIGPGDVSRIIPGTGGVFDAPPTVSFGCRQTMVTVHGPQLNNASAPYMRTQIVDLASNTILAVLDVPLPDKPPYTIVLVYPPQPAGSRLNVAMFLWNGATNVGPAAVYQGMCS